MADGEGGEISVHPDLRRCGLQTGEAEPKGFHLRGLGQHPDVGKLGKRGDQTYRIEVGETFRTVGTEQHWSGGETEKVSASHTFESKSMTKALEILLVKGFLPKGNQFADGHPLGRGVRHTANHWQTVGLNLNAGLHGLRLHG